MNDFVLYQQTNRVVTLTLNRPDERNAIGSQEACAELVNAVQRAASDPNVSCIVLTGSGSAFCAGGNVKTMLNTGDFTRADSPIDTHSNYQRGIQRVTLALWNVDVPTIAAVNGPVIGAGCDLACMCDIRIASDRAKFAESFLKLGLVPGDGGAWLLPRIVGWSRAAELTFTGDVIDAAHALSIGLVSHVVPHEELLSSSLALGERIGAQPPRALRLSKRLLRESQHARLPDLLELSGAYQALVHESADHKEAVAAFIEKRAPHFPTALPR